MKLQTVTLQFPSFGNPNAEREIEITFDFSNCTVAWRNRVFKVNQRLISVRKVYDDKGFGNSDFEYQTSVVSVEEAMKLMMKTVNSFKQPNQGINFLNELVGTVLRNNWEIDERDTTSYNLSAIQPETDNTRDAQQVLRDYDVVGFEVKSNGLMGKGLWVEGCLATATQAWGFALPDKTNKKRAKVGDAVVVSGRSVDGTKSIVLADKPEKQLNRETMLKHIAAELPVVHEDALVAELHDGKFAVSYGLADYSLLLNDPLLSLAVGDAGIVNREPINYVANKLLRGGINLELLFSGNREYQTQIEKKVKLLSLTNNRTAQVQAVIEDVKAEMKAHELNETVLQPGETIEFHGQAVVANYNTFPVRFHKVKSVRKGAFINTECRSLVVEVHSKAEFEDYNAKLRGQWIKGMTTRNDDYVVKGSNGESVDARLILNHNSVKNEKAVSLRGWANNKGQRIAWSQNGELRYVEETEAGKWILGELVDLEAVEAEIAAITQEYDIEQIVSIQDLEAFKTSNPDAFAGVKETKIDNSRSTEQIFTNRSARKDKNNRVYFNVIASGLQLKLQDEESESDEDRSKLIITKISSIEVKGKLSVSAFKERLATLKARTAARRIKTRSNGLFRPQQEVATTNTQSNAVPPELPSREEMFKQMMLMQEQMSQLQYQLAAKSSSSNGGSKTPVVRDVKELVEN